MNGRYGAGKIAISLGMMLMLLGGGDPLSWAAESKGASPAAPAAVSPGPSVKAAAAAPATPVPVATPGPKGAAPAPAVAPGAKAAPAVPPAPASEATTKADGAGAPSLLPPSFVYTTAGKSDPFKPFVELNPLPAVPVAALKKVPVAGRPISPLQQADIEKYRLVGIVGDQMRRTAMVEDGAAKKHYTLSVGTYIGMNEGRVVAILPDRVLIEEKMEMVGKKAQIRRVTLMLHKEDGGQEGAGRTRDLNASQGK